MLEQLKRKNPEISFYSVEDAEFASYGRILDGLDVSGILPAAEKIAYPENGVRYVPAEPSFETLEIARQIQQKIYGTLPAELGYCWGHSSFLNAAEWHSASEVNIAVTPLVLFLAHRWELTDSGMDASVFKAFYVPQGTAIEVYATTLHYCPCQVSDGGFRCVVGLPAGTNTALAEKTDDVQMTARNKWLVCHVENEAAKARGVVPKITGCNYKIQY